MIRLLFAFITAAALLVPGVAATSAAPSNEVGARIDRYLQSYMATAKQPGLAAVVIQDDEVILDAGYGWADREAGYPMTAHTPMAIGSTTKAMTALAVMQLVEQGLVDLDAPIERYVPDFVMDDPRAASITLRQVLSNSSGMQANDALDGNQDADAIERHVAGLANTSLKRDPGTGYEYANDGFILAGLVVQRVSGMPYERYIEEHVFAPLGMRRSTFDLGMATDLGLAQGYGHHRDRPLRLNPVLSRGFNPTGGAITTSNDTGRYFRALLNGGSLDGVRVLSPESVAQMWSPSFRLTDDVSVGLGWDITTVHGEKAVSWIGGAGTYGSIYLLLPDRKLAIGVINNFDLAPGMMPLAADLVSIALGDEPAPPPARVDWMKAPGFEPDRRAWDTYVGLYAFERNSFRVSRVGDRLVATIAGGDILTIAQTLGPDEGRALDFWPTGANEFVLLGDVTALDGMPVAFQTGPDGSMSLTVFGRPFATRQHD